MNDLRTHDLNGLEELVTRSHEGAYLAATAVERLAGIEALRNEPARIYTYRLTATTPTINSESSNKLGEWRSFGIINPAAAPFAVVPVYLGIGGGRATAAGQAIPVPASSALVLPVAVEDVEIGADPAGLGAADALIFVLRFKTVQPFFCGDYL